jgi:hypothetical protein
MILKNVYILEMATFYALMTGGKDKWVALISARHKTGL